MRYTLTANRIVLAQVMKTLLHICCGPCAVYTIKRLRDKGNDVEGLFYNPNIHPISEYIKRRESVLKLSEQLGFKLNFFREYLFEDFFRKVTFHEKGERCPLCWSLRLSETAEYANKNDFDGFCTTLLISPYQNHEKIKEIGQTQAKKYSVQFIYEDFRPGFKESHCISKEMGLYHQNYCGCIYSERERYEQLTQGPL